jgi:F-type H+-transporting ATPase subunit delta
VARLDEQELAVAGVYARSLLELAADRAEGEAMELELADLAALLEANPELASYLSSPLVDDEARAATLERAFRGRASELVVNTLQVMNGKGRLRLVPALAEALRLENEHRRGEVDVEVTTAVALSDEVRRRIAVSASRYSGRTARLVEKVDPSLLGGLVLKIGDRKIDGSLARQLHDAREGLFERASQELHGDKSYFDN